MSPELFDPRAFNPKNNRQTKDSDCYALGMVTYEVLSGQIPFPQHGHYEVVLGVSKGERPERPKGEESAWFVDEVWSILGRCWGPNPDDRPSINVVLQCLEEVSRSLVPPSPRTLVRLPIANSPGRCPDSSTEESTNESDVSPPPQAVSSQPPHDPPPKGEPRNENSIRPSTHETSALRYSVPGDWDLETSVVDPSGSDSEESAGISDGVSRAGVLGASGVNSIVLATSYQRSPTGDQTPMGICS